MNDEDRRDPSPRDTYRRPKRHGWHDRTRESATEWEGLRVALNRLIADLQARKQEEA